MIKLGRFKPLKLSQIEWINSAVRQMSGGTNHLEAQENAGRAADQQDAPADDIFGDFGGGNNEDAEADDDYAASRSFAAM